MTKRLSGEKPFPSMVSPVTDVTSGYDHLVAAIGASLTSASGADFICYVTPAEHLALPNVPDVKNFTSKPPGIGRIFDIAFCLAYESLADVDAKREL